MKKIHLYSFYIDEEIFEYTNDVLLERNTINIGHHKERDLTFAISSLPQIHTSIPISANSGEVYYNSETGTYRVWYYEPNRVKAIESISNYILNRVDELIQHHKNFIARLENERLQAIKLLEDLPKQID